MSRIALLITDLPPDEAGAQLGSMIDCMLHEPFYQHRTLCIPRLGCYVGWISRDGKFADCKVVSGRDRNRILVFAGEHFADRASLTSLVSMDDLHEERLLRELNGWFAGVLIDLKRESVTLFNDRFALHRIYFTRTKDSLLFSSEAKSLVAVRPESRQLDPVALGQVFAVGSVFDQRSLFHDVSTVPGGSRWVIGGKDEVQKQQYFSPEELEAQPPLAQEAFDERLGDVLAQVIPRYFHPSEDVAISLTAGLDTRAIAAFDDREHLRRSYTYGGMVRDCFDVRLARRVALACGYEHEVLRLGGEFLDTLPDLAEQTVWITDGTLDVLGSHEVYLSRLARRIAPVRLTGNYGSEILRGTNNFKPLRLSETLFTPEFLPHVREAERTFTETSATNPVSFAAFKDIPYNLYGRLAAAQSQLTVRSPYTDNELVSLAFQAPPDRRGRATRWHRLIAERDARLAAIPTDRAVTGAGPSLRTLPARLYNYLLFKSEWYYDAGMPHWMARIDRAALKGRAPLWFVGSHKIENYRVWLRDRAAEWLRSMLLDSTAAGRFFDTRRVREIVSAHLDGTANFSYEINKAVTCELVCRLFVEGNRLERPRGAAASRYVSRSFQEAEAVRASWSLEHTN